MMENGGKHPLGSNVLLYLARDVVGRGLESIENEYKAAVNLCRNQDPTMKVVGDLEERSAETGHHALIA